MESQIARGKRFCYRYLKISEPRKAPILDVCPHRPRKLLSSSYNRLHLTPVSGSPVQLSAVWASLSAGFVAWDSDQFLHWHRYVCWATASIKRSFGTAQLSITQYGMAGWLASRDTSNCCFLCFSAFSTFSKIALMQLQRSGFLHNRLKYCPFLLAVFRTSTNGDLCGPVLSILNFRCCHSRWYSLIVHNPHQSGKIFLAICKPLHALPIALLPGKPGKSRKCWT